MFAMLISIRFFMSTDETFFTVVPTTLEKHVSGKNALFFELYQIETNVKYIFQPFHQRSVFSRKRLNISEQYHYFHSAYIFKWLNFCRVI